jgi:hypothetical protein
VICRLLLCLSLFGAQCSGAIAATPDAVTPDGGRYYGTLKGGKLNGQGRLEWDNGGFYEGSFANGLMSGRGQLRFANGQYVGDFREGLMWGIGEVRYDSGRNYRGEFRRGDMHGKGRFETPEGDVYEGDFSKDEFIGPGSYTRKDGSRYEGEFRDWIFHGHGRFSDGHGSVYEGNFVDGQLEGPGKAISRRGTYEGEFKNWTFNGQGVLKLANGDIYKGGFAEGMYHGQGTLTYAKPKADGSTQESGVWRYGSLPNEEERAKTRANVETALYSQRQLLDKALSSLQQRERDRINLYVLAVAGDGSQEVFRREVEFVQRQFALRFRTAGHTVTLVNSRNSVTSAPMATVSSIREALTAIAARMDRNQDILFLFLTSHGSRDHEFSLHQNGMELQGLRAPVLATLLKESGIQWKVVVVSACYSGGFIEPLQDGRTLVITAARQDRRSFGCADEHEFTYFGRAFFKESLPKAASFEDAFRQAEVLVADWERKEVRDPQSDGKSGKPDDDERSLPQISSTKEIDAQLKRWWGQLDKK